VRKYGIDEDCGRRHQTEQRANLSNVIALSQLPHAKALLRMKTTLRNYRLQGIRDQIIMGHICAESGASLKYFVGGERPANKPP